MLENVIKRARLLKAQGKVVPASAAFSHFLAGNQRPGIMDDFSLDHFINLDDTDIWSAIKQWQNHEDTVLSLLCRGLIERNLFKMELSKEPPAPLTIEHDRNLLADTYTISPEEANFLLSSSSVSTNIYSADVDSIDILFNDGSIRPITAASDMLNLELLSKEVCKWAYCRMRIK
jgi:uncharacterized protein